MKIYLISRTRMQTQCCSLHVHLITKVLFACCDEPSFCECCSSPRQTKRVHNEGGLWVAF